MMQNTDSDKRIEYITFINVISCISVVILHTNGCFWNFSGTEIYWKIANIIESVFNFAVPLFFMITGITLMDFYDRNTLKEYFIKRIKKAGIPFLAWSLIGIACKCAVGEINPADINLKYLYQDVTGMSTVGIYWFFTPLFIIYLCMPLFAAVEKSKRKIVFTYLAVAGFLLDFLVPFVKTLILSDLNTPYNLPVVSGALIWPILGWLLHNCQLKKQTYILYILAITGLLALIIGTYVLSINAGEIIITYKGYGNVPCILYSVGAFLFLKNIGIKIMRNQKVAKAISWLGRYTFPIYMMQFYWLELLPQIPGVDTKSVVYILGAPVIIIPSIIFVTWCMRKIPIIKSIVP